MSDMSVKMTVEVLTKGEKNLKALQNAMRGMNAAQTQISANQATAGARAEANARKAAQATKAQTDAINAQAKAEKAASVAASAAEAKRAAELQRRKEAYRAFDRETRLQKNAAREPYWKDYWANQHAMKAEQDAAKAAAAQKKVTEAVRQTGNEAVKTESKLRRMARAVMNAPWAAMGTAAGAAIGRAMGKAIGDNVKSRVADALKGAWNSARGGAVGLMSNGRAAAGNGFYAARTGATNAGISAVSNAQNAINMETRLRPDLGSIEAARARRQFGDDWGKNAPFRTEDTRAALLELTRNGVDPQGGVMNMLGNAASGMADKGATMQSVAEAWAAATRGDYSQLSAFGFEQRSDSDGNSFISTMIGGKMQKIALDAEKGAETLGKLRSTIEARFSGQMGVRNLSPDGMMIRLQNNWDAFTGKIMDAGPWAYVTDRLQKLLGFSEDLGGKGLDELAAALGEKIRGSLERIEQKLVSIWEKLKNMTSAVDPIVQAFGGWENVVMALIALPFLSYLSTIIMAVGFLASAVVALGSAFAFLASPIGLVIAGIAAIAAGAYYLYANWDSVGPWFAALWEGMKAAAVGAWESMKSAIAAGAEAAVAAMKSAWDATTGWISDTVNGWVEAASSAWEKIKGLFDWNPLEKLRAALEPVLAWLDGWMTRIYDAFDRAIGRISALVDSAWEKIGKVWGKISGAVSDAAAWVGLGGEGAKNDQAIRQGMGAAEANGHLARLKDLMAEVQAAVAAFSLLPALQAAIGAAESYLAGVSFHSHGAAMMDTLAAGMRARAGAAIAAIQEVTQQIRDHLPHSPAKVGPLSDLHQIRFSETLAMGIHAGPAVAAVENVVGQMRAAAGPGLGIGGIRGGGAETSSGAGAGAGGAVTYSPTYQINGSTLDRDSLLDTLRRHAYEAQEILSGEARNRERLSYSGG